MNDADGDYDSDGGAVWIDNLRITIDGEPLILDSSNRVLLSVDVYYDLDLNDLVFFDCQIGAHISGSECPPHFVTDVQIQYGTGMIWSTWFVDVTEELTASAGGDLAAIEAISVRIGVKDMEWYWSLGMFECRNQAPYFDNIRLAVVDDDDLSAITPSPIRLNFAAYPNPFNPTTTVSFNLTADGPAHLAVYDVAGRRMRVLLTGDQPAGPVLRHLGWLR
ncbi:MAG: hypothetical protein GY835_16705 [bacterium]|nr:hypothetical protein [bacterium]